MSLQQSLGSNTLDPLNNAAGMAALTMHGLKPHDRVHQPALRKHM